MLQLHSKPELPPGGVGKPVTSPQHICCRGMGLSYVCTTCLDLMSVWCRSKASGLVKCWCSIAAPKHSKAHELPGMVAEGSPWRS